MKKDILIAEEKKDEALLVPPRHSKYISSLFPGGRLKDAQYKTLWRGAYASFQSSYFLNFFQFFFKFCLHERRYLVLINQNTTVNSLMTESVIHFYIILAKKDWKAGDTQ